MALHFDLKVNRTTIGRMEIRRVAPLGAKPEGELCTYDVYVDGEFKGTIQHFYDDGAWKLVAWAAGLVG